MGETKQLVDVSGRPMIEATVGVALASQLDRVVVVVGHEAEAVAGAVPDGADVVVNPSYHRGNLTSFRRGLQAAGDGPVMLLLGDMPAMRSDIVDRCLDVFETEHPWALVARYEDGVGHPYIFSPEALARSHEYEGKKALFRMLREQTAGRVREVTFDEPRPLDVNTPDDVTRHLGDAT